MTNAYSSRVFDAARKCKALMLAQSFGTPRTGFDEPSVALSGANYAEHAEIIQIVPVIGEDSTITWRSIPNGRDEVFDLQIVCTSGAFTPEEEDDALTRIEALANVVQRAFYDDTTGTLTPLNVDGAVKLEGVGQVSFSLGPAYDETGQVADHTKLIAQAVVTYRLHFRI
jgi:hypothetical protein